MFEHYRQPILSRKEFFMRMLRCLALALGLLVITLLIGTLTFHYTEKLSWIDAFLNSVLIMTGLGLVNILNTPLGKLFTAFYALFSTLVFFTILAIIFTPLLHRLLHHLHLEIDNRRDPQDK